MEGGREEDTTRGTEKRKEDEGRTEGEGSPRGNTSAHHRDCQIAGELLSLCG